MANLRALDSYRFLAATGVAIGHYNLDFELGLGRWTALAHRYELFVDFFFVLSGFVIALNYAERVGTLRLYGSFIWRRLARIWPLHMLTLAFVALLGLIGHFAGQVPHVPEQYDIAALPWTLALMHAWGPVWHYSFNGVSWSISAEFFVYLLFPLFLVATRRLGLLANLLLTGLYLLLMTVLREAAELRPWYVATYDLGALRAVPSFFLGIVACGVFVKMRPWLDVSWSAAHGLALATLAAMALRLPEAAMLFLFALLVLALASAETRQPIAWGTGRLGAMLGEASFALYMIHVPLKNCVLFVARRSVGLGTASSWLMAVATYAVALGLAIQIYRRFEAPSRRSLNRHDPFDAPRTRIGSGANANTPAE